MKQSFLSIGVSRQSSGSRLLLTMATMAFFWAIFDSFISYYTPILITEHGFSNAQMGLIYASSSVFGALLDIVLSKVLTKIHYRKIYLMLFAACAAYPFLLWGSSTIGLFLLCMAIWGLYYDLFTWGNYDFVSREMHEGQHASSFGVLMIFRSLGYMIGPIVAGSALVKVAGLKPSGMSFFFLLLAFVVYLVLARNRQNSKTEEPQKEHPGHVSYVGELGRWLKVGRKLAPILVFGMIISIYDAVFWTVGPLIGEDFPEFPDFGGLLIAMTVLPSVIAGGIVGTFARRWSKKRIGYLSFFMSCLLLIPIGFMSNPYVIIGLAFVSSFAASFAYPSIQACFADYLKESRSYDKELIGIDDFTSNIGYIIGPLLGGVVSGMFGNLAAFSVVGVLGGSVTVVLFLVTPREIDFHDRSVV